MTEQNSHPVDESLASWAHAWAAAASQTYEVIESISTPASPASELGRRDGMTMVLVDAVQNVVRGAEKLLGRNSNAVRRFNEEHPTLRQLRDRFEHYEDYVRGTGWDQREGKKQNGEPLTLETTGLRVSASEGGGPEGHIVHLLAIERGPNGEPVEVSYKAPSRDIAVAVRTLARDLLEEASLLDEHHTSRCEMCADPSAI